MRRRLLLVGAAVAVTFGGLGFVLGRPTPGPGGAASGSSSPVAIASTGGAAATRSAPPGSGGVPSGGSVPPGSVSPSASPSASGPPGVPSEPTANDALGSALQVSLDRFRRRAGIPGVSVTIVFADGSRWTGVSGLADVAAARKVTPDTAFAVGSISKTFLATLILALAAEGRIDLDASVRGYLPTMRFSRAITVRQLLDHTSGLADFFFGQKVDAALLADRSATWTPARTLSFVGKPYFSPGTGWHYSNTNYLVLGLLAEKVGGASLAAQYRTRFFDRLNLSDAFYQVAERPHGPLAHGYRFTGTKATLRPIDLSEASGIVPFRSVVTAAGGAGSIAASSRDIAAWAQALYGGKVLDPGTLAEMLAGVGGTARFHPRIPYGLGVQAPLVNGNRTYGHSGRLLGFQSVVRYLPDHGLAIAVLTNQSRSDPGIIARDLLRIALPPPGSCDTCPPAP